MKWIDTAKGELAALKIKKSDAHRTAYRLIHRTNGAHTDILPTLCCTENGETVYLQRVNELFSTGSNNDKFEVVCTVGLKQGDTQIAMWEISDGVLNVREITKFLNYHKRAVIIRKSHSHD